MQIAITVKPCDWEEYSGTSSVEYFDSRYGCYITEDDNEEPECRFYAAWGESDGEHFSTLEDAKSYCQEEVGNFISSALMISTA